MRHQNTVEGIQDGHGDSPVLENRIPLSHESSRHFKLAWASLKNPKLLFILLILFMIFGLYLFNNMQGKEKPIKSSGVSFVDEPSSSGQDQRKKRQFPELVDEAAKLGPLPEKLLNQDKLSEATKNSAPFPPAGLPPFPVASGNQVNGTLSGPPNSMMVVGGDIARSGKSSTDMLSPASFLPNSPAGLLPNASTGLLSDKAPAKPVKTSTEPDFLASRLSNRNYLMSKGSSMPCVLRNRLISSLPGPVQCHLISDVYSENGVLRLLEKGALVVGEYQTTLQTGQARLGIIWHQIKNPNGVLLNLESPATDSLGSIGVTGYLDTRWMERFGQAIMFSLIQDEIQAMQRERQAANTAVTVYPQQQTVQVGQSIANKMIDANINIIPIITINQGARINIMVNKNIDFSDVYSLEMK